MISTGFRWILLFPMNGSSSIFLPVLLMPTGLMTMIFPIVLKKQKKNIGKNFRKQGKQNSAASPIMLLHTGNRQEGGTSYIPFQRMSQRRSDLEVRKTISMPQMVSSKRVEKKIDDVLSKNIGKRLDQHMSRYMK